MKKLFLLPLLTLSSPVFANESTPTTCEQFAKETARILMDNNHEISSAHAELDLKLASYNSSKESWSYIGTKMLLRPDGEKNALTADYHMEIVYWRFSPVGGYCMLQKMVVQSNSLVQ